MTDEEVLRARAKAAEKALRELVGQLPRCDVGDCDEVSTRAQYGYDGRITYCCQKHGKKVEAAPWGVTVVKALALLAGK